MEDFFMQQKTGPSNSWAADLESNHIRETVTILNLVVSLIEGAAKEGDDSIASLADLFTSVVKDLQEIGLIARRLAEDKDKDAITGKFREVADKMSSAVTTFQFFDQLSQRLSHVCRSLNALSTLIGEPTRISNPDEWNGLRELIKTSCVVSNDRKLFEAIMDGATLEEALYITEESGNKEEMDDNVELF